MPNDKPLNFLVTGANGMLGHQVVRILRKRGFDCHGTDVDEVNLTVKDELDRLIETVSPNHIIHCAAYTNVDRAEEQIETARAVNVEATRYIAESARKIT
ncbi:MAG: sugar nucleotide-binding protein, partial [Candidatus Sumerlaeota bacterium]